VGIEANGTFFTKFAQLQVASVRESYDALEREANRFVLTVNKTKFFVAGTFHPIGQNITFGDKQI
jgi:hypothetical protein